MLRERTYLLLLDGGSMYDCWFMKMGESGLVLSWYEELGLCCGLGWDGARAGGIWLIQSECKS